MYGDGGECGEFEAGPDLYDYGPIQFTHCQIMGVI